jgi:FlaG/FlaF family flagellin (archaellin)
VVGVVLMISLTLVLGSLVGAAATDIGTNAMSPTEPSIGFAFTFENTPPGQSDALVVTHQAGVTVGADEVSFVLVGAEAYDDPSEAAAGTCTVSTGPQNEWQQLAGGSPSEVQAGSTVSVTGPVAANADGDPLPQTDVCDSDSATDRLELDAATVRIVWTADDGDTSYVLAEWSGPDA